MNTLELHTTLTTTDWRAYLAAWCQQLQARRLPVWQALLLWLVVALGSALAVTYTEQWSSLVLGAALAFGVLWLQGRRVRQQSVPDADGGVLGPCTLRFDADGVHVFKQLSRASHDWRSIRNISVTSEHLFLWIDRLAAIIVPVRNLPAGLTAADLHAGLQQMCSAATAGSNTTIPFDPSFNGFTSEQAAPERVVEPASLRECIDAIGRLLVGRVTAQTAFNPSDRTLVGVVIFYLGVWSLIDWARTGADPEFDWYGILPLAWHAMVITLIAYVCARTAEPRVPFRQAFSMALALVPLYAAGWLVAEQHPNAAWPMGVALALYASHCLSRGLQSIVGRSQVRAQLLSFGLMLGCIWLSMQTYANPQFWYASEPNEVEGADFEQRRARVESLLYGQPSRIDAAVARIQRPQQLEAAGFFLGFAGVGGQRVFAREIAMAQQRISQHFATATRSIQLVNDQQDLESRPLASPSGLQHALAGIAAKMDLQRDVLFLALSSHGSRDAKLSVSNDLLPLNDLSAEDLAKSLRDSGIRRKVIIVSACYSGTFIPLLRNPDTIIITASAADRNSFGCADDRELTYFGEAFYRDALQHSGDLRRAFELAKAQIARREAQEGKRASNPQAYFGAQLEMYLQTLSNTTSQSNDQSNERE